MPCLDFAFSFEGLCFPDAADPSFSRLIRAFASCNFVRFADVKFFAFGQWNLWFLDSALVSGVDVTATECR
jgi:hypothetical protein